MFRRNPDHAEYWEFSWYGCAAGAGGGIHSNWVENRASFAFGGPVPRNQVVLELCCMDISISVQVECAMFGSHQGVGGRRIKRGYPPRANMRWPLPATASEELLEWPLTAPVTVAKSAPQF